MRDQPKWEGKQACPVCGRVTYSFLHSCPGVPQRPLRHSARSESDDTVLCSCGEPVGHADHCDSCCGCGVADQHERMATVEHLRRCPICDMVEVDNPMRPEFRPRRGLE